MISKCRVLAFAAAIFAAVASANPETGATEVLIHVGPEFTTPGLEPNEEIRFIKEFAVDTAVLKKPASIIPGSPDRAISAEAAIALAKASVDDGAEEDRIVTRLELLDSKARGPGNTNIRYFLIAMTVEGSEVHRVVLMDGTVVKSRLRQLPSK